MSHYFRLSFPKVDTVNGTLNIVRKLYTHEKFSRTFNFYSAVTSYGSQIFSYLSQANIYKIHFQ